MMDFIRRERIYLLMLFFILAVNLAYVGHEKKQEIKEESLSTKTFEEIGVTEQKIKDFFDSGKPSSRLFKYLIILGFFAFIISLTLNIAFIFQGIVFTKNKKTKLLRLIRKDSLIRQGTEAVPWGIADLLKAGIILVFMSYIIGMAEASIVRILDLGIEPKMRMILNTFFIDVTAGIVILYFVIVKYKEKLAALGLKFTSFIKNILSGLISYIFILPLLLVILIVSVWFLNLLGYSPPPQPVFEIFMEEKKSVVLLYLTIFVSVFGPIVEEMFFRGFMYSAVKKRFGILAGALVSASIFSLLHSNIFGFLPIMTLGVLLAYLYETTGSLVASITVHILHNSIIVGFIFFIKELMRT